MQPSDPGHRFDFKGSGDSGIGSKEIVQVHQSQQADVGAVEGGPASWGVETSDSLQAKAENRCQLFIQFYPRNRAHVPKERVMCQRGCPSRTDPDRPVVQKLVTFYRRLGICMTHKNTRQAQT